MIQQGIIVLHEKFQISSFDNLNHHKPALAQGTSDLKVI